MLSSASLYTWKTIDRFKRRTWRLHKFLIFSFTCRLQLRRVRDNSLLRVLTSRFHIPRTRCSFSSGRFEYAASRTLSAFAKTTDFDRAKRRTSWYPVGFNRARYYFDFGFGPFKSSPDGLKVSIPRRPSVLQTLIPGPWPPSSFLFRAKYSSRVFPFD